MDKLREEFEAAIRTVLLFSDEELEWQPERNCYAIYGVHLAWWAWRTSRETLVVQLPSKIGSLNMINGRVLPEAENYDEAIDDCADAIRDAGLSVKGEE